MSVKTAFTLEQVQTLTEAVKQICARRGIDPRSTDGQQIASRLVEEYTGAEAAKEMERRFLN
ncbi:hypothetical protein NOJ05_18085 [Neorhizobium galegae]|uniref:hypothetical protein n=1 Tax=Neorhizobium galegae TaxID=399 RepID=UPI002102DB2A|nr:hypothetical protein [Neorhizobium galegae]MCQ1779117.1 hypothetical protein [Neorhizobium galegae]MCQ1799208.1 hypothetical protein [Neorhizobium galegae]